MQELNGINSKSQSFDQLEFENPANTPVVILKPSQTTATKVTGSVGAVVVLSDESECTNMSNQQNLPREPGSMHAPQPPPFNPLAAGSPPPHPPAPGATQQIPSFPNSVVSDLMRVYESLTQSSTPQDPGTQPLGMITDPQYQTHNGTSVPHQHYYYSQQQPHSYLQPHAQQQRYYQQPGYAEAPGAPIVPPVPEYAIHESTQSSPVPSEDQSLQSRGGRSLRTKRSVDDISGDEEKSKNRKKGADLDGRWSKRFTWPDDLHRDFVSAIFDVGLKHSSPSAILDHMPKHEPVTSERIKSHLQKYRLHRSKAKKEFMTCYEASMKKFNAEGLEHQKVLSSGEVAAHVSYATKTDTGESPVPGEGQQAESTPVTSQPIREEPKPGALILPMLTEEEKCSPIGTSLGYLLGLFFSIRSQLLAERAAAATRANESANQSIQPVGDLYTQFANDSISTHVSGHDGQQDPSMWPNQPLADGNHQHDSTQDQNAKFTPSSSSTLTNIEENTLMKREMQSQMQFQNKMRALKQQELNKYKKPNGSDDQAAKDDKESELAESAHLGANAVTEEQESEMFMRYQGAGEAPENMVDSGPSGKERCLSIGNADEFWNTDVVDEQLFEFLMNP